MFYIAFGVGEIDNLVVRCSDVEQPEEQNLQPKPFQHDPSATAPWSQQDRVMKPDYQTGGSTLSRRAMVTGPCSSIRNPYGTMARWKTSRHAWP
jgi:hypothetical protein